jgi:hypothetical protein
MLHRHPRWTGALAALTIAALAMTAGGCSTSSKSSTLSGDEAKSIATAFRDVTAPNADTLYTNGFIDVNDEPWVLRRSSIAPGSPLQ